jgi:hypothetical protein
MNQPGGWGGGTVVANTALDVEAAFTLLQGQDYAGAYLLLKNQKDDAPVAAKFNLALCQIKAARYAEAATLLESALTTFKRPLPAAPVDEVYRLLAVQGQPYLKPMSAKLAELRPLLCKENICRLLIDTYVALERLEKIKPLTTGLLDYPNVQAAIKRVEGGV